MEELRKCSRDHLHIVHKAEECERHHGRNRTMSATDEAFAGDTTCSETGSSSAASRTTAPFYTKEEKKELKGEYWEEDVKVKEEYGESTRQQRKREKYSGGSLWVGDLNLKEEDGGNGEKTDDRGRNPGARK